MMMVLLTVVTEARHKWKELRAFKEVGTIVFE